jgi:hypothetical protein
MLAPMSAGILSSRAAKAEPSIVVLRGRSAHAKRHGACG